MPMAGPDDVARPLEFQRAEFEDFVSAVSGALAGLVQQAGVAHAKDGGGLHFFPSGIERIEVRANILKYAEFTFIVAGKDAPRAAVHDGTPAPSAVGPAVVEVPSTNGGDPA